MSRPTPARLVAAIAFAVLLVGAVAAFAAVQDLKRSGTIFDRLDVTRQFSPNGDGFKDEALISFRLTRPDVADIEITNGAGHPIEALANDRELRSYFVHGFAWDGLDPSGKPWPEGFYRVQVRLHGQERTITPAVTIQLRLPNDDE